MKIADIIFWLLIALIVGVAIWKIVGSPTDTAALISISLFIAGSEIMIWKTFFRMDKKVSIGFIKIRNEIDNKLGNLNNSFNNLTSNLNRIDSKIEKIEELVKKRI